MSDSDALILVDFSSMKLTIPPSLEPVDLIVPADLVSVERKA